MFGSDQMIWPDAVGMAIEGVESADFLTKEQKRDIFYNNAVRFLRLDEKKWKNSIEESFYCHLYVDSAAEQLDNYLTNYIIMLNMIFELALYLYIL